jgi:hypothetical protein
MSSFGLAIAFCWHIRVLGFRFNSPESKVFRLIFSDTKFMLLGFSLKKLNYSKIILTFSIPCWCMMTKRYVTNSSTKSCWSWLHISVQHNIYSSKIGLEGALYSQILIEVRCLGLFLWTRCGLGVCFPVSDCIIRLSHTCLGMLLLTLILRRSLRALRAGNLARLLCQYECRWWLRNLNAMHKHTYFRILVTYSNVNLLFNAIRTGCRSLRTFRMAVRSVWQVISGSILIQE